MKPNNDGNEFLNYSFGDSSNINEYENSLVCRKSKGCVNLNLKKNSLVISKSSNDIKKKTKFKDDNDSLSNCKLQSPSKEYNKHHDHRDESPFKDSSDKNDKRINFSPTNRNEVTEDKSLKYIVNKIFSSPSKKEQHVEVVINPKRNVKLDTPIKDGDYGVKIENIINSPTKYKKTKHDLINEEYLNEDLSHNLNEILNDKNTDKSGLFSKEHNTKIHFKKKPGPYHTQIMFTDLKKKVGIQWWNYMNNHRFSTFCFGTKRFNNKNADFYIKTKKEEESKNKNDETIQNIYKINREAFNYAMTTFRRKSFGQDTDKLSNDKVLTDKQVNTFSSLVKILLEKLTTKEVIIELKKETLELSPIPKLQRKKIANMSKEELKNFEKAKTSSILLRKLEFSTHVTRWKSGVYDKLVEDYLLQLIQQKCIIIQRWWRRTYPKIRQILMIQRKFRQYLMRKMYLKIRQYFKYFMLFYTHLYEIIGRLKYNRRLETFHILYSKFAVKAHCRDILMKIIKIQKVFRKYRFRMKYAQNQVLNLLRPFLHRKKRDFMEKLNRKCLKNKRIQNLTPILKKSLDSLINYKKHYFLRLWKMMSQNKFTILRLYKIYFKNLLKSKREKFNMLLKASKLIAFLKRRNSLLKTLVFRKDRNLKKLLQSSFYKLKPRQSINKRREYILTKYSNRIAKNRKSILRLWFLKFKKTAKYLSLSCFLPIPIMNIFHTKPLKRFFELLNPPKRNGLLLLLSRVLRTILQDKVNLNNFSALFRIHQVYEILKSKRPTKKEREQSIKAKLRDIVERKMDKDYYILNKNFQHFKTILEIDKINGNADTINSFSRKLIILILKKKSAMNLKDVIIHLNHKKLQKDAAKVLLLCNKRRSLYSLRVLIKAKIFEMFTKKLKLYNKEKAIKKMAKILLNPITKKFLLWKNKSSLILKNYKSTSKIRNLLESMQPFVKCLRLNKIKFFDRLKLVKKPNKVTSAHLKNYSSWNDPSLEYINDIEIKVMVNNKNVLNHIPINVSYETVEKVQNVLYKKRTIHSLCKDHKK